MLLIVLFSISCSSHSQPGAAAGASFEDIQSQLIDEKASSGWKEQIADAVDRVVDKMLKETPPETEEERQNCETMRETIKGMFHHADTLKDRGSVHHREY